MNASQLQEKPGIACTDECLLRPGNTNCGGWGMSVGLPKTTKNIERVSTRPPGREI